MKIVKTKPKSNYSASKRDKQLLRFTEPKRQIILRSTNRALQLLLEDKPIEFDSNNTRLSSVNLLTTRFHSIKTINDSCVISESAAKKLVAVKYNTQTITIPKNAEIEWKIEESKDQDIDNIVLQSRNMRKYKDLRNNVFSKYISKLEKSKRLSIVFRNQVIIRYSINDYTNEIRCNIKHPYGASIISIKEGLSITNNKTWTITYKSIIPISFGDKLMNQTGHKFTIGQILPDNEMPYIENVGHAELLIPYQIGKRCTPSTMIEEIGSIIHEKIGNKELKELLNSCKTGKEICNKGIEILKSYDINYPEYIQWKNVNDFQAPYGYIRIFRTDHIAEEVMKYSLYDVRDPRFSYHKSVKFNWHMIQMLRNRNAENLANWIQNHYNYYKDFNESLNSIRNILKLNKPHENAILVNRYIVIEILQQISINNKVIDNKEFENTILDSRIATQGGYIETYDKNGNKIIVSIPKFAANQYIMDNGDIVISKLLKIVNNIIAISSKYSKSNVGLKDISENLKQYVETLTQYYSSLIRVMNNPKIGCSLYGTVIADTSLKYNEIGIPKWFVHRLRKQYNITKKDLLAIVFRQPVHSNCELSSMYVRETKGNVIRIHPIIVELFRGDHDGDAMMVCIPPDPKAYQDLSKIIIDDVIVQDEYWVSNSIAEIVKNKFEVEHEIKERWELDFSILVNKSIQGLSSWPGNLEYEKLANEWNFLYTQEHTEEELFELSKLAAFKMASIKTCTAQAGGIALSFLGWLMKNHRSKTQIGLEFYRFLAEDALKAKSDGGNHIPGIFKLFISFNNTVNNLPSEEKVYKLINNLLKDFGEENLTVVTAELFYKYLLEKAKFKSIREFHSNINPVLSILRHHNTKEDIFNIIRNSLPETI